MKKDEYRIMFEAEEQHWWYCGLRRILLQSIKKYAPKNKMKILDVGCGTGILMKTLSSVHDVSGIDYSEDAISFCRLRELKNVKKASANDLPFENNVFDLVTCMDVLYHVGIDIEKALHEINRVLKPQGILAINLPAFSFLYSSHDRAIETAKRFTKKEVKQLLLASNFKILKLTYWDFFLFPIVATTRLIRKKSDKETSDISIPRKAINEFLFFILRIEANLIKFISLPWGTSVFAVAQKPNI
jgi:ubiquinone/menaquinone biosynthesis C-methylase UbiE